MKLNFIKKQLDSIIKEQPKTCIVLGSGLNNFIDEMEDKKYFSYHELDSFLTTNVKGHKGEFIFGYINKIPILCANGRFHYYEGHTLEEIGIIVSLFNLYNPKKYIITNSSGTVRLDWNIGDLMIVNKFIDFSFINSNKIKTYPLKIKRRGIYNNVARDLKIKLRYGAYTYTIGPTYETASEIQEIIKIGGDVVGMSTFPEYLNCKKLKINPIIVSCLTNYGAGLKASKVLHSHVLKNAKKTNKKFNLLIKEIICNSEI
jgi:purine-nucleoside phosphorylase